LRQLIKYLKVKMTKMRNTLLKTIAALSITALFVPFAVVAHEDEEVLGVNSGLRASTSVNVRAEAGVSGRGASTSAEKKDALTDGLLILRARLQAGAETRIRSFVGKMLERFNAAVERLEKLTLRIESRIAKMKAEGKITTNAETHIAVAKEEIAKAKVEIAKIPAVLETAFESEVKGRIFAELRVSTNAVQTALKNAHAALARAIASLKPGSPEVRINAEASSSAEVVQ
jgi:hypothetical protein